MACPNCGAQTGPAARFCERCGATLPAAQTPTPQAGMAAGPPPPRNAGPLTPTVLAVIGVAAVAVIAVVAFLLLRGGGDDAPPPLKLGDPTAFTLAGEYDGPARNVSTECSVEDQDHEAFSGKTVTFHVLVVRISGTVDVKVDRSGKRVPRDYRLEMDIGFENDKPTYAPVPGRNVPFHADLTQVEPDFAWSTYETFDAKDVLFQSMKDKPDAVKLGPDGKTGTFDLKEDLIPLGLGGVGAFISARGTWVCP